MYTKKEIIIKAFKDGIGWFWLFFICALITKSYSDFVVNSDLYQHGLMYDLAWFIRYASAEFVYSMFLGLLIVVSYWFSSPIFARRKFTAVTIMFTTLSIWIGGALDFIWFFFEWLWRGKLLGLFDVWWWFPQYWLLGIEWTTLHQLIYTIVFWIVIGAMWYKVVKD